MSKEQIEEMAKELCGMNIACKDCRLDKLCLARNSADILYNAGYRKQGEWISVDERLPAPFVSVLVYMPDETPHPTVREGFINKHGKWYAGGFDRLQDEVVAWMEMPEPPKKEGAG